MDLGPVTMAVVNDARPVTLRVPITNGRFTYTPLAGALQGTVSTYGPVTGTLELAPGAAGAPPAVLLDGTPLAPVKPPAGGQPPAGPARARAGAGRLRRSAGRARGAGALQARGPPARARPRGHGQPAAAGPGALALRASAKVRSRTRVLGKLRKAIPAAGRRTLKLKLKRKPPARLRLAITFTPAGGAKQTQRVTVKRR